MEVTTFRVSHLSIINHCYLIHKENMGVLVDPAWDFELFVDFLTENKILLRAILLTHAHNDHTNLAEKLTRKYGVPVYMSRIEIETSGFNCTNLQTIEDGQLIKIDELEVECVLTPGHTEGSICYCVGEHAFTGDTIYIEGVGICSSENVNSMYDTVQHLKKKFSQETMIWPGHSFGETVGKKFSYLLKYNIYFSLDTREHFVDLRMRKRKLNQFQFK